MTPTTLRARAVAYFVAPKTPPPPIGDVIPLVQREPPPRISPNETGNPDHPPGSGDAARHRHAAYTDDLVTFAPRCAPGAGSAARHPHAEHTDDLVRPAPRRPVGAGSAVAAASTPDGTTRLPGRAAVLGRAAEAVPAAAALAGALREVHGASAAAVATWTPGGSQRGGCGPGTPAAHRLAGRLTVRGLAATAHGRLAWLALDDHVFAASVAARRASAALDVPLVIALAGPRCDIVETLLHEQDVVLVVAADPDGPLARLATAACRHHATACPAPRGVRRALALAGLAGGRAIARDLELAGRRR
jgi:hypothetical protein